MTILFFVLAQRKCPPDSDRRWCLPAPGSDSPSGSWHQCITDLLALTRPSSFYPFSCRVVRSRRMADSPECALAHVVVGILFRRHVRNQKMNVLVATHGLDLGLSSLTFARLRQIISRCAPRFARARTVYLPMPVFAPVTRQMLPCLSFSAIAIPSRFSFVPCPSRQRARWCRHSHMSIIGRVQAFFMKSTESLNMRPIDSLR